MCTSGYSGDTCGNNIDDCSPDPCINGMCIVRVIYHHRNCYHDIFVYRMVSIVIIVHVMKVSMGKTVKQKVMNVIQTHVPMEEHVLYVVINNTTAKLINLF